HWSLSGEANGYGGKLEGLFLLPVITLVLLVGLKLLPRIDPRGERYADFAAAYEILTLAIAAFMAAVYAVTLAIAFGAALNATRIILPLVGVLLVVVGAVLGQVQPNWFVGIRTPWTLSSEKSWSATHRMGRWVLIGLGAVLVVAGLVQTSWALVGALLLCVAGCVGLIAYSFVVWRDDPDRTSPRPT
ncbi:MAG: SdpI family protein, partial [Chloroflexi bacterium]|nr:SdpI family protein [Chloroflexota bacterium]